MSSLFTHPVVPVALRIALGRETVPPRLLAAAIAASWLPDLDVLGTLAGVPDQGWLGHRGFAHSFLFAALLGLLASWAHRPLRVPRRAAFWFVALGAASHDVMDMLTDGGNGVALLSPFTDQRFLFSWHGVRAAPLGIGALFTARGMETFRSELQWIWLPVAAVTLAAWIVRRMRIPAPPQA